MEGKLAADHNLALWDGIFASRAWGRYPPEELVRFIARTFGRSERRDAIRVLEVGCGPGANLWYLAREKFSVAGIDGSPHAIRIAQDRLRAENLDSGPNTIDLRVGNFVSLPWDDEAFDAIVDIEAIYANPMAVIRATASEIHRTLKPGGYFFGKLFGPRTTGCGTGPQIENGTSADPTDGPFAGKGIAHFFTEEDIRDVFADFTELSLDWVHRSDHSQTVEIFEWIVTARKASP